MSFRRNQRRIIWTPAAEGEAERKIDDYPRLYEVVKAIEWLLERHPDTPVSQDLGDGYRVITSKGFPFVEGDELPEVVVVYRFDETTVTFWNIRITALPSPPLF